MNRIVENNDLEKQCFSLLREHFTAKRLPKGTIFYWDDQRTSANKKRDEEIDILLSRETGKDCKGMFRDFWNRFSPMAPDDSIDNAIDSNTFQINNKKINLFDTSISFLYWRNPNIVKPFKNEIDARLWVNQIKYGWFGGDEEKTIEMLDWFSSIVHRPCYKIKVMIVLRPKETTMCYEVLRPILEILGPYGVTVNNKEELKPFLYTNENVKQITSASMLFVTEKMHKNNNTDIRRIGKEFPRTTYVKNQSVRLDNFTNIFIYSKTYQYPKYGEPPVCIYTREIVPPENAKTFASSEQLNKISASSIYDFLLTRDTFFMDNK
jgi:hypothetical protein